MLFVMVRLSVVYIRLPAPGQQLASQIRDDSRYYPYFEDYLGALGSTHIDAHVPKENHPVFGNRKGTFT